MSTALRIQPADLSRLGRVSVVGGAGFIGLNLCRHLASSGVEVMAIDPRPLRPEAIDGVSIDHQAVLSPETVQGSSVVFHVAGSTEPASSNIHLRKDMAGTVGLTLDVLEAARSADISQVVHVSSGGTVYGPKAPVPTPETAATDPVCAYGISKLAAEGHVQLAERLHGIRAFNLRVANPYGPWQDPRRGQGAVNAFLYRAMRDEPIELWGDGEIVRDFLHVNDVVNALCSLPLYAGDERVFNIGSGAGLTINKLIADIETLVGRPIQINRRPGRDADVPCSVLDIDLVRRELGWRPLVGWHEGLEDAMAWMKQYVLTEAETT
ncbi:MAG: NAD-dependent epimerase/dehydratase family protein [Planctomycetota bacterium]|nr:NAD-dependent epimerase/dehydratase family protein [Planctomycetota bacterium]